MQENTNQDHGHKALFEKKYWTIDDVAIFTRLSKGTIYNLTYKRQIPYQKKRRKLIFHPQEILNWIYTPEE